MPWFRVDDNLAFHHKVVAAGNAAMGMWVRAGSMCSAQLTDGFVPDHMISSLGGKAQAKRLVDVGLWVREDDGYRFHEWGERQPSKESVEAERANARERMAELRANRKANKGKRSSEVRPNSDRTSEEVRSAPTQPYPALPDPPTSGGDGKPSTAPDDSTAQALLGEWIEHCSERPPGRVVGHVGREVKAMLAEGIKPERIRAGLAEWHRKGLHPSTLPSVVHETTKRTPLALVNDDDPTTLPPVEQTWMRRRPQ